MDMPPPLPQPAVLLRTRCTQGTLIITDTTITVQLGSIKSETMSRTSLVNVESKVAVPSILGQGGGINLTFYGQSGQQLHANLVPPKDAETAQSILLSSVQSPVAQTPSHLPPSPLFQPGLSTTPVKGVSGSLNIVDGNLILVHKAPYAFSREQEKVIPLNQITSISYVRPGAIRHGYIRFSFVGGQEFKATPRYKPEIDDNAVVFTRKQEWGFLGIKNYIEQFIANNRRSHP